MAPSRKRGLLRRAVELCAGVGLAVAASGLVERAAAQAPAPSAPATPAPPAAPAGSAASPVSGPLGPAYDDDASMPVRADRVASYTLRATLDPAAHTVHGEGTITWKNASRVPQRELWVHLYLNAFKNERTVFLRTPMAGFRGGQALSDWGYVDVTRFALRDHGGAVDVWPAPSARTTPGDPEDETDLRVELPRDVAPGESITIEVAWDAHLPSVTLRTGWDGSFHMVAQWFPKIARLRPDGRWAHFAFHRFSEFYADFGDYDVTVDVPEAFLVGATGRLEEESRARGRVTRRFRQEDVHDFAFAAWDEFRERTASVDGVAVRCLFPPGYERAADAELEAATWGLAHFGAAYGRYPYETLTLVHPPERAAEAGGMEYPTLITTGGPWYLPLTGVRGIDIVTIHELGHQWFYGLVATNEFAWPFLDEGVNSYAESEALEARFPGRSLGTVLGVDLALPSAYRAAALRVTHNAPIATGAADFTTGGDYGALVYSRTATVLHTLARVYGRDEVGRALGRYARRYRFDHPEPDDLVAAFRDVLGDEPADALRASLFDRAWVDYSVDEIGSDEPRPPRGIFGDPKSPSSAPAVEDEGFTGWALVRRRGPLRFPVDIELRGEDGTATRVRWDAVSGAERIPYRGRSRLASAVIDPDHRVLLDETLANNARRRDRGVTAVRVLERALFAVEAALLAGAP